ncbi:MAG: hypothetical protein NZ846_09565 [Thermus sp.]|nr:hypothetical protein [Thermus sp.]MCS7219203.1 hypothetical protein [Thermus sp.]
MDDPEALAWALGRVKADGADPVVYALVAGEQVRRLQTSREPIVLGAP